MTRRDRRQGACGRSPVRHRSWPLRLALFALIFHALLPVLHRPPPPVADAPPGWALASLCRSPDSIAPLSSEEGDQQLPAGKAPVCPICISLQVASLFLPRDGVALPPPGASRRSVALAPPTVVVTSVAGHVPPARAPPEPA